MRELTVQVAFLILISISSFSYTIFSSEGLAQEQEVMPGSDANTFLSLNEIFNNVENSVVQITTSVPPVSILNPSHTENSTCIRFRIYLRQQRTRSYKQSCRRKRGNSRCNFYRREQIYCQRDGQRLL